jgi:hypothetical protein
MKITSLFCLSLAVRRIHFETRLALTTELATFGLLYRTTSKIKCNLAYKPGNFAVSI